MKLAKRIIAFAMVAVMLVSACAVFASASASVTLTRTAGHDIVSGAVKYVKYNVYGSQSGHTEASTVLTFNPANGYIPMAFAKNCGSAYLLDEQYSEAINKYGYEVAGVINGSFFSMADGTLCGQLISNGKIACAHVDYYDSFVAFGSDGSMNIVNSQLDFKLRINGVEVPNGLAYLNKRYSVCGDWGKDRFFYYDTSCGSAADSSVAGYEIICQKVNNSELAVGQTLFGQVTEIRKSSYGAKFGESGKLSDKFVLFVRDGSSYCSYVENLKVGDSVSINTTETIEASREIMENANSVITNVGFLVKDGVDQTDLYSTIGTHSVTGTYARWTAFGQKADGSYVFFTSEGGGTGTSSRSLTLKDVAAAMIKLGCKNVIRMDGGGSSAMYVSNTGSGYPGYVQSSSRDVSDCILIVKKSSTVDSSLNSKLTSAIASAKASDPDAETLSLISEAEAILASANPVSGDVKRLLMELSPMGALKRALNNADGVSITDYSASVLKTLREAYDPAKKAYYGLTSATEAQIAQYVSTINACLAKTKAGQIVSKNAKYTSSSAGMHDTYKDNGTLLTDGVKGSADGGGLNVYAGWTGSNEVVIDLGSAKQFNKYTVYLCGGNWGIAAPTSDSFKVDVYTSNSATSGFTLAGSTTAVKKVLGTGAENTWTTYEMSYKGNAVTARYVKVVITNTWGGHIWMDEVEVEYSTADDNAAVVTDGIVIKKFNSSILSGDCTIFKPNFGTITVASANHAWTTNVVCKWNASLGAYVVKAKTEGAGSSTPAITLASDEILISAHAWDTVVGSAANKATLAKVTVGQKMLCYGVDIANQDLSCASYIKFVAANGTDPDFACEHSYTTVVTKPTCTEGGYTTYTCSKCGDSYVGDQVGKNGHDYAAVVTKPTCTEGGYTTYTCADCGDSYVGDQVGKNGHDYEAVVTKPTCTEDGYTTYTCADCGDSYVGDKVGKNGHDYEAVVTKPTCTEDGYTTYTCADCGDSYVSDYVDAQHTPGQWEEKEDGSKELHCTECGDLIDFKEALPEYNYDINGDGEVDMFDYFLIKSIYFDIYAPTAEEASRSDTNGDGEVDMFDYFAVKNACLF